MLGEWKRIFLDRRALGAAAVLLAVNLLLFLYTSGDPADVRTRTVQRMELLQDYQAGELSEESLRQALHDTETLLQLVSFRSFRQSYPQEYALQDAQREQQLRDQYPELADRFDRGEFEEAALRQRWDALSALCDSIDYKDIYRERLRQLQSDAQTMASIGIFRDQRAVRNIQKTAADYAPLEDISITPGNDRSMAALLSYGLTPLLGVLFAIILVSRAQEERKYRLRLLVFSCKNGRCPLTLWRGSGLLLGSALFAGLLYGSLMLADVYLYGIVDVDRTVQSVPELFSVTAPMTLGQLWGLYLAWGIGAQLMVTALTWCVFSLTKHPAIAISTLGGLLGGSFLLYRLIPDQSVFALLKYANPAAALDMGGLLTGYQNVFVGPLLVENDAVAGAVMLLTLLLILPAALWCGIRRGGAAGCRWLRVWLSRLSGLYHRCVSRLPLMGIEAYKVLVIRRGGLLLLALVLVLTQVYQAKSPIYVGKAEFVRDFYSKFEGSGITPELLDHVQELEAELARVERTWEQASAAFQNGEIGTEEYELEFRKYGAYEIHRQGLETIHSSLDYLRNQTHTAVLVDPTVYDHLLSETILTDRIMDWASVFVVTVLCAGGFQVEEKAGLPALLRSTRYGRGRLALKKALLGLGLSGLVYALLVVAKAWSVIDAYGPGSLDAPVHSLPFFENCPIECSIGWGLLLYFGARWLVYGFFGCMACLLSQLWSYEWAVCAGALGAIVPEALSMLGWGLFEKAGLHSLKESAAAWVVTGSWGPAVWLLAIILLTGGTCLLWKRRRK